MRVRSAIAIEMTDRHMVGPVSNVVNHRRQRFSVKHPNLVGSGWERGRRARPHRYKPFGNGSPRITHIFLLQVTRMTKGHCSLWGSAISRMVIYPVPKPRSTEFAFQHGCTSQGIRSRDVLERRVKRGGGPNHERLS